MDKIFIKNISNHTIIVVEPMIRLRAQLRPMQRYPVKADDFDILAVNEGFIRMVRQKKLQVEDVEKGIEYGLIDPDEIVEKDGKKIQEHTEDYIGIRKILETGTDLDVKELLKSSSKERRKMIAEIALDSEKISYSKTRLIQEYSGINIDKARSLEG